MYGLFLVCGKKFLWGGAKDFVVKIKSLIYFRYSAK